MAESESSLPTRRQGESADDYTARLKATPSSSSSDSGGGGDSAGAATRSVSTPSGNARTVAGLMGVAIVFSVIGAEIKAANPSTGGVDLPAAFSEPFLILGGGTIATVILALISDAGGDTGRRFAVGLAALACVTATLVNGGPVWRAIDGFLGAKATTPTGATTATKPTTATPTTGATAGTGSTGTTALTSQT